MAKPEATVEKPFCITERGELRPLETHGAMSGDPAGCEICSIRFIAAIPPVPF